MDKKSKIQLVHYTTHAYGHGKDCSENHSSAEDDGMLDNDDPQSKPFGSCGSDQQTIRTVSRDGSSTSSYIAPLTKSIPSIDYNTIPASIPSIKMLYDPTKIDIFCTLCTYVFSGRDRYKSLKAHYVNRHKSHIDGLSCHLCGVISPDLSVPGGTDYAHRLDNVSVNYSVFYTGNGDHSLQCPICNSRVNGRTDKPISVRAHAARCSYNENRSKSTQMNDINTSAVPCSLFALYTQPEKATDVSSGKMKFILISPCDILYHAVSTKSDEQPAENQDLFATTGFRLLPPLRSLRQHDRLNNCSEDISTHDLGIHNVIPFNAGLDVSDIPFKEYASQPISEQNMTVDMVSIQTKSYIRKLSDAREDTFKIDNPIAITSTTQTQFYDPASADQQLIMTDTYQSMRDITNYSSVMANDDRCDTAQNLCEDVYYNDTGDIPNHTISNHDLHLSTITEYLNNFADDELHPRFRSFLNSCQLEVACFNTSELSLLLDILTTIPFGPSRTTPYSSEEFIQHNLEDNSFSIYNNPARHRDVKDTIEAEFYYFPDKWTSYIKINLPTLHNNTLHKPLLTYSDTLHKPLLTHNNSLKVKYLTRNMKGNLMPCIAKRGLTTKQNRNLRKRRNSALYFANTTKLAKELLSDDNNLQCPVPIDEVHKYYTDLLSNSRTQVSSTPQRKHFKHIGPTCNASTCIEDDNDIPNITADEVSAITRRMNKNTTPGHDGVKVKNILQYDPQQRFLTLLVNMALKLRYLPRLWRENKSILVAKKTKMIKNKKLDRTETMNLKNYWPITISNIGCRVLHKVVLRLLQQIIPIQKNQFAFSQDATLTCIKAVRMIRNFAIKNKARMYMAFLDIQFAFDTLSHDALNKRLTCIDCPNYLREYVINSYTNSSTRFHTLDVKDIAGIPQYVNNGFFHLPTKFVGLCTQSILYEMACARIRVYSHIQNNFPELSNPALQSELVAVQRAINPDYNINKSPEINNRDKLTKEWKSTVTQAVGVDILIANPVPSILISFRHVRRSHYAWIKLIIARLGLLPSRSVLHRIERSRPTECRHWAKSGNKSDMCLTIIPSLANLIDNSSMRSAILPRIKRMCIETSILSVRVNCLLCVGKLCEKFDKWMIIDDVIPILQGVPSKEPAVLMTILGVIKVAMSPKDRISIEALATKFIPLIIPLSIETGLNASQFDAYMKTIKEMINTIEAEQKKKISQMSMNSPLPPIILSEKTQNLFNNSSHQAIDNAIGNIASPTYGISSNLDDNQPPITRDYSSINSSWNSLISDDKLNSFKDNTPAKQKNNLSYSIQSSPCSPYESTRQRDALKYSYELKTETNKTLDTKISEIIDSLGKNSISNKNDTALIMQRKDPDKQPDINNKSAQDHLRDLFG
ncbi:hypothetical protein GJ496_005200 [Pomphorhynchus laevis]|nr:hypothetical protein GJ496_005200 [Pomphorhynchus laevis]